MEKRLSLVCALVLVAAMLVGCEVSFSSSIGTMMSEDARANHWTISARTLRGSKTRTINFTAESLAALQAESKNSEGAITLLLTQGDVQQTIALSDKFSGDIDMADFAPGRVQMQLNFENAKDVRVVISW